MKEGKEEADFLARYDISPGHMSPEWVWPIPPPFHTHEEIPLVKSLSSGGSTSSAAH